MSKTPVVRDETVAWHPADFPDDSLVRMARNHAVFAQDRALPALAALLRELADRVERSPRPLSRTTLRLPAHLATLEALGRYLTRRMRRPKAG